MSGSSWPARLSFNDMMAHPRSLQDLFTAAARAGVTGIGLHIRLVEEYGFDKVVRLSRDTGVAISNYAAVGHWASGIDISRKPRTLDDAIRSLDQAAELGTDVVGVTAGRLAADARDLQSARSRAVDGIAELVPYAKERNLKLAIEPIHPIFLDNGPVIVTLRQTLDMIEEAGGDACLGVLLDTFHVWWEPDLLPLLGRARDRTFLVQLSDWSPEMASVNPRNRAMPGEGCTDWDLVVEGLEGYQGWFDVEAINADRLPSMALEDLFDWVAKSSTEAVGPLLRD